MSRSRPEEKGLSASLAGRPLVTARPGGQKRTGRGTPCIGQFLCFQYGGKPVGHVGSCLYFYGDKEQHKNNFYHMLAHSLSCDKENKGHELCVLLFFIKEQLF